MAGGLAIGNSWISLMYCQEWVDVSHPSLTGAGRLAVIIVIVTVIAFKTSYRRKVVQQENCLPSIGGQNLLSLQVV